MVIVHNHPSGDPTPSQEDVDVTRRLSECGMLLGIKIVDHIIVGDGQYCSLQSSGYM
jgi:DNA repair protein RadC